MGLKVFTNTKVRKPWYCSTENYIPAGVRLSSSVMSGAPMHAMRTSGKGTGSCYHLCSEQRSRLYFGVNTQTRSGVMDWTLGSSTDVVSSQVSASAWVWGVSLLLGCEGVQAGFDDSTIEVSRSK